MAVKVTGSPPVARNPLPVAPPVAANIFMGTLLKTLGFSSGQVQVLAYDGYNAVDSVLYWNFDDVHNCCELKTKMPVIQ